MNPCPCGYHGTRDRECTCTTNAVERYRAKISGPLMDRIDLHVDVPSVGVRELTNRSQTETSTAIRERVMAARAIQMDRFRGTPIRSNGGMSLKLINKYCELDRQGKALIERAIERLGLSARAYARILKVARTVADLSGDDSVQTSHVAEAIGYRNLDRNQA